MRMVVDLPEPFGPRKPVTSPEGTSKVRWSTAVGVAVALRECVGGDHCCPRYDESRSM